MKNKKRNNKESLIILVDKREQLAWPFLDFHVQILYDTLSVGDYSLFGYKDKVALERKSLNDLFSSLNSEEKHNDFMSKMGKLSSLECKALIIEASYDRIMYPAHVHSRLHPNAVMGSLCKAIGVYSVPVIFAGGRRSAQKIAYGILKHYRDAKQNNLEITIDPLLHRTYISMDV